MGGDADLLARRARVTPDRTAVVEATSGESWTYAELDEHVSTTAARLAGAGLGPGDHVGLLCGGRPAAVRVGFAVARLGAVLVPLNTRLPAEGVAGQCAAGDLAAVVCESDTAALAREAAGDAPVAAVDEATDSAVDALSALPAGEVQVPDRTLDDVALLAFTSGSTGDPKPVALSGRNLLSSAVASAFRLGVDPGDRWLDPLAPWHVGGLAPVVRSTLYGTAVVLQREFDPEATLDALASHRCTGVSLVPTMLDGLLDAGPLPDSLRFVLLGGAPAGEDLLERCFDRDVPVHPTFGATETASQVATATPDEVAAHPGTVGRPLLWTDLRVVDEDGDPLPRGHVGEVVVDGPTVAAGYYGRPEATAAAFRSDGFHTGDRGRIDEDGRLWIGGRLDDRIVTGGENVDAGAVADVLRDHEGVADAAVVGVSDPEWGRRVAALVVPADRHPGGASLDLDALDAHCRDRLAAYECPKTVAVVDRLPRTDSGTVDREAVRTRLGGGEDV